MLLELWETYEAYKNLVFRLALSYTRSRTDAEDICQDVFVKLVEQQGRITPGKERAWLCAVTVNRCKNLLRSAARRRTEPLSEDIPFRTAEESTIFYAVMALRQAERVAVYLHHYAGYSTKEIAALLRVSQTAVTSRLSRAYRHLRIELEGACYDS